MGVYKRGGTYWFKFLFQGQLIRESARTNSKTVAREAERARRRELEMSVNRIPKRTRMPLFSVAAREWLAGKATLAPNTAATYGHFVSRLIEEFGPRLICDIGEQEIGDLQRKRLAAGKSARTVNFEVSMLRQVLKKHRLWSSIADNVTHLRERKDVGRAITPNDERKLLEAIMRSRSPALLPLFILSVDSGLRASEVRALRRTDFALRWKDDVIESGLLTVPTSKTEAGTGRAVPLTRRTCAALTLWLARFRDVPPNSYVFPRHSIGLAGNERLAHFHEVDFDRSIGQWKKAWKIACRVAKVSYRWHDCRHTFITRLAENPKVSEETIRALAGHVSKKMLERYSHIRISAKKVAIAGLEETISTISEDKSPTDRAQNWAQSEAVDRAESRK